MQLAINGEHIDVGDALRTHVTDRLEHLAEKYFNNALHGNVNFIRDAHLFRVDLKMHVGRNIVLQASAEATEIYPAFDMAADKLEKRLRRHKRRLRDHHQKQVAAAEQDEIMLANAFILRQPEDNDDEKSDNDHLNGADPAIIAEMETHIATITVAEAVMRLDLADINAMMFRNSAHNGLNMVYRRKDGHIGWVDPTSNEETIVDDANADATVNNSAQMAQA